MCFRLNRLLLIFLLITVCLLGSVESATPPYQDSSLSIDLRLTDLLSRMTLEEKIAQLQCIQPSMDQVVEFPSEGCGAWATAVRAYEPAQAAEKANKIQEMSKSQTRLGIPVLIHDEGLHGLIGLKATSFPQAIGLASTWEPDLIQSVAEAIALESRTRGIHQLLSPVVNIARDVRWGRVEETYGEDPYLTTAMGVAFCKGLKKQNVIATPKHFVANVGDGGRDSHAIHFSKRLLREVYFPAFKACIQQADAGSIMAAYNSVDGIPCSSSKWLLTDILRTEWGFQGFVVSDYGSAIGIHRSHYAAETLEQAAAAAVCAGLDAELSIVEIYGKPLLDAVQKGLVSEAVIEQAASRILRAKFELGLFDNPFVDPAIADSISSSSDHKQLALEAARKSMILLKNNKQTLPIPLDLKAITVLGPNANVGQLGGYSGFPEHVVTVLEGIKNRLSEKTDVYYFKNPANESGFQTISSVNLRSPSGEPGLEVCFYDNITFSGKPVLKRIDKQIDFIWDKEPAKGLPVDRFSAIWKGTITAPVTQTYTFGLHSDDGVRLFIDNQKVVDKWIDGNVKEQVQVTLKANKPYDIRIEYYENAGRAELHLGWIPAIDNYLTQAKTMASKSQAVVVVTGVVEGENKDRAKLGLTGFQPELINALSTIDVPLIIVMINGSAVTMSEWIDKADAIIEAWYPGQEGGYAVADALFGIINPGGKLPITFPQFEGQLPLYYGIRPSGRSYDYSDMSGKPLFAFGHGLSYTQFKYSNLVFTPNQAHSGNSVQIRFTVKNTGDAAGDEVVQLYLRDNYSQVTRPLQELKRFKRITLKSGEVKPISFTLNKDDFAYLNESLQSTVEPGDFEIQIGSASDDIRLKGKVTITQ